MNAEAKKRYKDIDLPFLCPINKREFNSTKGLSVYVTKTLKQDHSDYYDRYINHRDNSCFFCGDKGTFISVGKGYRNLCDSEECMKKSFNSHSIEGFMYKNMCCREDAEILFNIENKRQLSERMKTQSELRKKDPDWDKKRSRNCKEFWIEKGLTEEESITKSKEVMCEIHEKTSKKLKENPENYLTKYPTKIEYYTSKGISIEDAKNEISKIQNRFSLEKCIDELGKELGTIKWQDRQDRWLKTLDNKTDEEKIEINRKKLDGSGYSKISQVLFWDIYNNITDVSKIKFSELNKEFFLLDENKKWFAYDFVDTISKKCIEFNGDFWHCNPDAYNENYMHRVKKITALEIWTNDKHKIKIMNNLGYQVLTIWDSEYRKNPEQTLKKCIEFINN